MTERVSAVLTPAVPLYSLTGPLIINALCSHLGSACSVHRVHVLLQKTQGTADFVIPAIPI
jgi:hypothetical protein